jgi:hypothetical protein
LSPKKNQFVTIIDNETGQELSGSLLEYTEERIVLLVAVDAKTVHFKEE